MESKIDNEGKFLIRRPNGYMRQACSQVAGRCCGDHCPLFQEVGSATDNTLVVTLYCGKNAPYFRNVADER